MQLSQPTLRLTWLLLASILFVPRAWCADAIWTNRNSGFWGTTNNWLNNVAPISSTGVAYLTNIANGGAKTVTINTATPTANRTIRRLDVGASAGSTNTLLVDNLGTNVFLLRKDLNVLSNGVIMITNSTFHIDASVPPTAFNVDSGRCTFESGLIFVFDNSADPTNAILRVGRNGAAQMTMNGGAINCYDIEVGDLPGSFGTLFLNAGLIDLTNRFTIADNIGSTGHVFVTGGQIATTNDIRVGDDGTGLMQISGGAVLADTISVGQDNTSDGRLIVLGGYVSNLTSLNIARLPGSTGEVNVAGTGRINAPDCHIHVGRENIGRFSVSNGTVNVRHVTISGQTNLARGTFTVAGGVTTVTNTFNVGSLAAGTMLSTGVVSVVGGTLNITNELADGTLTVSNGTFTLTDGLVVVDIFNLPDPKGRFTHRGGTLSVYDTTVSNGTPFFVGDGTNLAVLHLRGGTNRFLNGLVINSNAVLIGCGTIVGPLTNFGTIATNCGSSLPPVITSQPTNVTTLPGANASFKVAAYSDPPLAYQWQRNGTNLPAATTALLSLANVAATDAGTYSVLVNGPGGTTPSSNAVLRVLVVPLVTSTTLTGGSYDASFQSESALNYTIEFKNDLQADPTWMFLTNAAGTGGVIVINDPAATGQKRFYRISTY